MSWCSQHEKFQRRCQPQVYLGRLTTRQGYDLAAARVGPHMISDEDEQSIANMQHHVATHPKVRPTRTPPITKRVFTRDQIVQAWHASNQTMPGLALMLDVPTCSLWRYMRRVGLSVAILKGKGLLAPADLA